MGVFSIHQEDLEAHDSRGLLYPSRRPSPQFVKVVCCGSDHGTAQHLVHEEVACTNEEMVSWKKAKILDA